MCPQISLEAKRFNRRQVRVHGKHGRARLGQFSCDVAAAPLQHIVDGLDRVGGRLNLGEHDRLHQARRRQQERRIRDTARRGNDLTTAAQHGLLE